jgi:chromate reductase
MSNDRTLLTLETAPTQYVDAGQQRFAYRSFDWVSRPYASETLAHKPFAIMGASPSNFGGVRAQLALRQTFIWTNSDVLIKPEVIVFRAHERLDADGRLIDAVTAEQIRQQLQALSEHIERGQHRSRGASR